MSEQVIDLEAWEALKAMAEPEFLAELIDEFLLDAPRLIEQMRRGLPAGDLESVRRAAHTLKSNSASFGGLRLSDLAREIEMLAKNGALDGAESRLAAIETEFTRLAPALEALNHAG